MNLILFVVYSLTLGFLWDFLDKKYNIIDRFQDKNNKGFRKVINIIGIVSLISILSLIAYEHYLKATDINIKYIEWMLAAPFLLWMYIGSIASERNKIKSRKNKDIEIKYCYFCGSKLNENKTCPNCNKKLEL